MCKTINSHYINGAWVEESKPAALHLKNPATGLDNMTLMLASSELATTAIESAHHALTVWQQYTANDRAQFIARVVAELKKRRALLIDSIVDELGCPRGFTTEVQVDDPINAFEQHVQWTKNLQQEQIIDDNLTVYKEAVGVCSIITPWNYPLHQLVAKVAPALAAGCTMVVKPSEFTPTCALLLAEAIEAANLPKGVFNLIVGAGSEVGPVLTTHPLVRCISFTGSTAVGKHIQAVAAQTVKRVLLELGGKSPYLICPTENLKQAVDLGIEDVMANTGQTCVALTRMLVHESQFEQAKEWAKQHAASIIVGSPDASDTFMGPVINQAQLDKISSMVQNAQSEGAEILCGGVHMEQPGYFFEPTVITNLAHSSQLAQQEVFGPVLVLFAYKTIEDAIQLCNDTPYGLSARVWSDDTQQSIKIAQKIDSGQVYINGAFWHNSAPFGGYKESGNGRELGPSAIDEFFELKSIIV